MQLPCSGLCILYTSLAIAGAADIPGQAASKAPAAASAGTALRAVLGLDDACRRAAEASGSAEGYDLPPHCALGAVQHSAHARLASATAPEPLDMRKLDQNHSSKAFRVDAEDSVIILAARYFAGSQGLQHVGANFSRGPSPWDVPNSWRRSQEQWGQRGQSLPSWTSTPKISVRDPNGHERASIVAPISAIILMVVCVIALFACKQMLGQLEDEEQEELEEEEVKEDEEAAKEKKDENKESVNHEVSLPIASLQLTLESRLPKQFKEASAHVKSTAREKAAVAKTLQGTPIWYYQCFRFASGWEKCGTVIAFILAGMHGALMPIAFYQMDRIFNCIYMPNDDGSLPPVKARHVKRDQEVWNVTRIYLFAALGVSLSRSISVILMSRVSRRQTYICRQKIFQTLLRQGPAWHDLQDSAEMTSRVSLDTFYFQQGLAEKPLNFIRAVVVTCIALCMAAYKDWKLTIVMSLTMPVSAYAISVAMSIMESHVALTLKTYSSAGAIAETAIRLLRTVLAFNGQKVELQKYQEKLITAENRGNRMGMVGGFCAGVNFAISSFAMCLGIYAGSIWILQSYENQCWVSNPPFGTCLTGGTMMGTIFTVMWGFSMGLGTMSEATEGISSAKSASARIFAIIDAPIAAESLTGRKLDNVQGNLCFESLAFRYPGRQEVMALRGITLRIPAGNTYALVGPSGSGKSTMVNMILRFYEPTSGSILFDGEDTKDLDAIWMRSKMALVEQEPPLFAGSIYQNISYGLVGQSRVDQVQNAAKMANAHKFITQLPRGYETDVGERGAQLSGGQKQRIAIARSLVRDPTVMILDEATSALDSASERIVQDALNKLMQDRSRTLIVIAHRLSTIRNADQICVMESGKLVEQGTHESLLAKVGLYHTLAQSQMQGAMTEEEHLSNENPHAGQEEPVKGDDSLTANFQRQESGNAPPLQVQQLAELEVEAKATVARRRGRGLQNVLEDDLKSADKNWQERIWKESRPEYGVYCLGVVCICLSSMTVPWYMMHFGQTLNLFNRPPVVLVPDTGEWVIDFDEAEISVAVTSLCFIMQFCGTVVVFLNLGSFYLFNRAAEALVRRLRTKAFSSMMRQEIAWHDERPPGMLSSRLSEQIPRIKMLVGNNLASGCQSFLGVFFGLGLALIFSWKYTLSVLGALPILGMGAQFLVWAKFDNENHFGGLVSEALSSIKTVAAFNLESKLMKRFTQHLDTQGRQEGKSSLFYGIGMGLLVGGIFLLLCVDVWFANVYVNRGEMSQDRALVVFFCIFSAAMSASTAFVWIGDRAMAVEAAQRFFTLIDRKPSIDSMSLKGERCTNQSAEGEGTRIEFEAVDFYYPCRPDVAVFSSFSLVLEPNTITAIVGPSGAGKSTAVALLQRFYDPQGGVIRFNGTDISTLNVSWLRSQMGLVSQEPVLFAGSILDNIKYGCKDAKDVDVVHAARAANAHGFVCNLPDQYLTEVGNRGGQMSGGQKQRIAIARALVRKPSVFLLDEATAALDTASERQVQEALDELLKDNLHTTLIIAHRLSTIQGADQICVMNNGKIEQKGTHQELLKQGGLYSQLVGSQQILMGSS